MVPEVYSVSKLLEMVLAPQVEWLASKAYKRTVRLRCISPPDMAVGYDYLLECEDGSTVKADLKCAYQAKYKIAPATVQNAMLRAQYGVDPVILTSSKLYYVTTTSFTSMLSQYSPDKPLPLSALDQYSDSSVDITSLDNYQSIEAYALTLHKYMAQLRER